MSRCRCATNALARERTDANRVRIGFLVGSGIGGIGTIEEQ